MDNSDFTQQRVSFRGFVCFWRAPRQPGESTRQRFFSIYEDLRQKIQRQPLPAAGPRWRRWRVVRISEAGRWFLGIARR